MAGNESGRGMAPAIYKTVPASVMEPRPVRVLDEDLVRDLQTEISLGNADAVVGYLMDYHGFQGKLRKLMEECSELIKASTGIMDGRGSFEDWLEECADVFLVLEQFCLRLADHAPEAMSRLSGIRVKKLRACIVAASTDQALNELPVLEQDGLRFIPGGE